MIKYLVLGIFFCSNFIFCLSRPENNDIITGAENMDAYLDLLKDKNIGIVVNQSSLVGKTNLVDTLLSRNINILKIFSPEHGFRGGADAGESIDNSIDPKTGLTVISLYGKNRKPSAEQLKNIDVLLFDLQDVGTRFFTYMSTLHYIMESCAENNIKLIILDRPNPNGFYVDGPVLEMENKSFVGMYPIPVVHGMTLGEMAQMAIGEGWVCKDNVPDLKIIKCKNYNHNTRYNLPVKPSPNLPDMRSVYLYPSLCLLEGTKVSLGRGTHLPFQIYGHPSFKEYDTIFVPRSIAGMSKNPVLKDEKCFGYSLRKVPLEDIQNFTLNYLINAFNQIDDKKFFFNPYFTLLAGNKQLQRDIETGKSLNEIRESWQSGLNKYKVKRKKYLLYPDFIN